MTRRGNSPSPAFLAVLEVKDGMAAVAASGACSGPTGVYAHFGHSDPGGKRRGGGA